MHSDYYKCYEYLVSCRQRESIEYHRAHQQEQPREVEDSPGQSYAAGSIQSTQCDQSEGAVAVGLRIQNAPIGVLHGRRFLTYYNYNEYDIYLSIDRRRSYPLEHAL